jgi:hypothetical protein
MEESGRGLFQGTPKTNYMEKLRKVTLNNLRIHAFLSERYGHSIQHSVPTDVTATKFAIVEGTNKT